MEVLKSGDVPALVTNIEVLNILSKRIEQREVLEQDETLDAARKKKANKLRHRDYIEGKVYDYLETTACAIVDFETMPEFVGRLKKGSHGKEHASKSNEKLEKETDTLNDAKNQEEGYNLTDAEILQVMNHMPKEPVEIHLMIEELMGRMDEDRQSELLQLIAEYAGAPDEAIEDIGEEEEIVEEEL